QSAAKTLSTFNKLIGYVSLAIIFILNFSATYAFIEKEIIFHILLVIPVVSRSIIAIMLLLKPTMKESSFATYFKKGTGKLDIVILISFLLLATVASYILLSVKGLLLVILMIITAVLIVNNSCKELGGINGDIAGHGLVLIESIALLFLSVI
ncbi:adenosylcobinamide-GDP ribazoletransferase, partial [uncultured Clostridium sp.]|uniref:adenosylcobinamide-GDP ribazoletransferase n=1 Tax=uncultured Clostridium sp. TaxID=59620 RepID=UPI0025E77CF1